MNYKELKEILDAKNIYLKDFCEKVGYTRAGLTRALNQETIELRKLKMVCETARISPSQFFDTGTFGIMQNAPKVIDKEKEALKKEIEYLRQRLSDKEDIIKLLKEKNTGYSIVAEP